MPDGDDDSGSARRRHDADNGKLAGQSSSRQVVDEQIKARLREIGINLADDKDSNQVRRGIDLLRDLYTRSSEVYAMLELAQSLRTEQSRQARDWLQGLWLRRDSIEAGFSWTAEAIRKSKGVGDQVRNSAVSLAVTALAAAAVAGAAVYLIARGHP